VFAYVKYENLNALSNTSLLSLVWRVAKD